MPGSGGVTGEGELERATLGGGCFWCLEAALHRLRGVASVESGYAGGHEPDPDYRQVCSGTTGHAEVVQVAFDPEELSYRELLQVFFALHDPTTRDRQGPDVGSQYRSIVLWHDRDQARVARDVIGGLEVSGALDGPVVTEVEPLEAFHPAEDYHRDYYARNPEQAYCRLIIEPKLEELRRRFGDRLDRGEGGTGDGGASDDAGGAADGGEDGA